MKDALCETTRARFEDFVAAHAEVHRLNKEIVDGDWEGHTEVHRLLAGQLATVAEELKRRLEEMNNFREEARKDKVQFAQVAIVDRQIETLQVAINAVKELQAKYALASDLSTVQQTVYGLSLAKSQSTGQTLAIDKVIAYIFAGASGVVALMAYLTR